VSRLAITRRRQGVAAALAATIVLALAAAAAAHFTTTGSGSAIAGVGTLTRPAITAATAGAETVTLSWSGVTPPGSGAVSYYVTRDGGSPAGNCPTSSSPSSATGCTDSGLALGSHRYTVTAVWRSWTATSEARTVEVTKLTQTIAFTSTAPNNATVGGATYTVTATGGGSGNPVTFTIDAISKSICSIAGKTVSFTAAGTCKIDANQAGNGSYEAAPQAQQSFSVGKGSQTIAFTSTAPTNAIVGGASYSVAATAGSGLTVSFSIDASATSVCSISAGNTVSFQAAGTCKIDANQPGNANWNPAPQAQQSFTVGKGEQTIAFTSTAPTEARIGGTYTPTAKASSELPVTLTVDASSSAVCSIAGGVVSFKAAGTCRIDANQAGNSNWNPAPQAQQSFTVTGPLTISGVVRNSGKKKVDFTGTNAVAATAITVTICKVNHFPCTAENVAGTSIVAKPSAGAWTSEQDNNNLGESATYFAQAIQGTAESSVFSFSTTGL
jgi:hypothetical protein